MVANNFVYLFGPTGTGKTRLLKRYHDCTRRLPGIKTRRLCVHQFSSELMQAVTTSAMQYFRLRYLSLDVLMVDNAWLLLKRPHLRQELFSLFLAMTKKGKFVVLAGDIAPEKLFDGVEINPVVHATPSRKDAKAKTFNRDKGDAGDNCRTLCHAKPQRRKERLKHQAQNL